MSTIAKITSIQALEILDSRGRPTVKCSMQLADGNTGEASVPSGASTGQAEAHELRDGDPNRYQGMGCLKAVSHINNDIANHLKGRSFKSQASLDQELISLDGTADKSRLGANAILAISMAYARCLASHMQIPLFQYFAHQVDVEQALPGLTVNLFSGGKHAGAQMPIQDILLVPTQTRSVAEALVQVQAVYMQAVKLISEKYGSRWLTADEGGLAPPFPDIPTAFEDVLTSIERAGLTPGQDMALAIDVASSHFYKNDFYHVDDRELDGWDMIELLEAWTIDYPLISIEDGLAEEDWPHWTALNETLPDHILILGDDLLCTNTDRINKAIESDAASALLMKVNQVGTLTEAAQAFQLARKAGWQVVVSARSGETEDNWLADLATGWGGDYIKVGSITQSERLAKYNRLLEIERSI